MQPSSHTSHTCPATDPATHRRTSADRRRGGPTVLRVGSGIIYAVLIGLWAAYFIPRWLRRHEELSESRSVEKFDHAMRILSRREPTPDKRYVVMPPKPEPAPSSLPTRSPHPGPALRPGPPAADRGRRHAPPPDPGRAGARDGAHRGARTVHAGAVVGSGAAARAHRGRPGPPAGAGAPQPRGHPHPAGRPAQRPVPDHALRRAGPADVGAPRAGRGAGRRGGALGGRRGGPAARPRGRGAPSGGRGSGLEAGPGAAADVRQQADGTPPDARPPGSRPSCSTSTWTPAPCRPACRPWWTTPRWPTTSSRRSSPVVR